MIKFHVSREIERVAEKHLVFGIGRFVQRVKKIKTAGAHMDVFRDAVVTSMEAPAFEHLISQARFKPVSVACEIIFPMQWKEPAQTARGDAQASEIRVVVTVSRNGSGKLRSQ